MEDFSPNFLNMDFHPFEFLKEIYLLDLKKWFSAIVEVTNLFSPLIC